jgi:DNA-binding winged helix-turn-helix (wHTH) protein
LDELVTADEVGFGAFRMQRRTGRLYRHNGHGALAPVRLGGRARDLLRLLVDHAGDVVSKSEIMDAVWPGQAVEENNLTVQMSTLRRILDAGRAEGSFIETVPGRGYRF